MLARTVAQRSGAADPAPPRTALLSRWLRVNHIDYKPGSGSYDDSDINVREFVRLLTSSNFWGALNTNDRQRLTSIGAANLSAVDIPLLATAIVDHVIQPTGRRAALLAIHRPAIEGALVRAAPVEAEEKPRRVFASVLAVSSSQSRSKGQASAVAVQALPSDPVPTLAFSNMRDSFSAFHKALKEHNNRLGNVQTYINEPDTALIDRAVTIRGYEARTPHQNRAGWLPVHTAANPLPGLDAAADAWARKMAAGPPANPFTAPVNATLFAPVAPPPGAITAETIESSALPTNAKKRYYRDVYGARGVTSQALVRHAWNRVVDEAVNDPKLNCPPGCAYIEFTATEMGGISRVVWDYVRDICYIGVHYTWVEGYNPFFEVTGVASTYS